MKTRRRIFGVAALVAAVLGAAGLSTNALLTNAVSSSEHVDTTFTTLQTVTPPADDTGTGAASSVSVSPDGQWLAYRGTNISGEVDIYSIGANGQTLTLSKRLTGLTGNHGYEITTCWVGTATSTTALIAANASDTPLVARSGLSGTTWSAWATKPITLGQFATSCVANSSYVYLGTHNGVIDRFSSVDLTGEAKWGTTADAVGITGIWYYVSGVIETLNEDTLSNSGGFCATTTSSSTCAYSGGGSHRGVYDSDNSTWYVISDQAVTGMTPWTYTVAACTVSGSTPSCVKGPKWSIGGGYASRIGISNNNDTLIVGGTGAGAAVVDIATGKQTSSLTVSGPAPSPLFDSLYYTGDNNATGSSPVIEVYQW